MQGFNMGRYVPPDFEGITTGNALYNKHPLGNRAKPSSSSGGGGGLTVRFELPYSVWCASCQPPDSVLIGQGTRFNALKKKVGNYFSTPIWSFRFKHAECGGWIEIRTDPQRTRYVVVEGGKEKEEIGKGLYVAEGEEEGWGRNKVIDTVKPGEKDPFAQVEHKRENNQRALTDKERLQHLFRLRNRDWKDPYEKSRKLRRTFRQEKKRLEAKENATEALRDKMSLGIGLLEESQEDRSIAGQVDFAGERFDKGDMSVMRKPLFSSSSSGKSSMSRHRTPNSTRPADRSAKRRRILGKEIWGNTRAAQDPFLTDMSWEERRIGSRRKEAETSSSSLSQNNESKPVSEMQDLPDAHELESRPQEMDPRVSSPTRKAHHQRNAVEKDEPAIEKSALLVNYSSDDDT